MIRKPKKSVTYEITREMNTVDNWTQHLQLGHLKIMICLIIFFMICLFFFCFFFVFFVLKLVTKRPGSHKQL